MSDFFTAITDEQRAFIEKQPVFFVATAAADARINLSPKGMDSFRVLGPNLVGYLDVGGSGNETQAHLAADGRITVMFCAFDQPPLILRLYGRGRAILPQDDEWDMVSRRFAILPGTRQIFLISVESVQESCGWGVPFMRFEKERTTLARYHEQNETPERLERISTRTRSIDGLPLRVQDRFPERGTERVPVDPGWVAAVLNYWLNEIGPDGWFNATEEEDARCLHLFRALWEAQRDRPAADFLADADTALAALVLFDQFPRNMFRGEARAFATDPLAREIARAALQRGFDEAFVEAARPFFYMPFMHSEDLADQDRSVELFSRPGFELNLEFAKAHRDIIARFGRFPHRNAALGRPTLPQEEEAVAAGSHW
ncbi:DUF924 family protein [Sphingobium lignivorans]|uniref:Uncharacterized protein (DUF924 family) n=1 Tax=Sphingobium lignivorans TaxID=2735886 RepID=A0ABR6NMJ9_9SPHN|nr:uncharacterized protein (DUF924 family) [Sphingobium lignivorans]